MSKDGNSKDGKSKDSKSKDSKSKDGKSKDGKSKDGKSKDGKSKDVKSKDSKSKDGKSKDGKSKDDKSKDGKSKDSKSKERKIKVVKTSLLSITDNPLVIKTINEVCKRCTIITNDILNFLKSYFINQYEENKKIPKINIDLLASILNIVTYGPSNGRQIRKNNKLNKKLNQFYLDFYSKLGHIKDNRQNLSHIFKYVFNGIITNFENNVKLHFDKYLVKYMKYYLRSHNIHYPNKKIKRLIPKLLYNKESFITPSCIGDVLYNMTNLILPRRKTSLATDLEKNPQKYLRVMMKITRTIKDFNDGLPKDSWKICLLNVFPINSSYIPSYIPIDTTIILDILYGNGKGKYYSIPMKQKRDELWTLFFSKLMNNKSLLGSKKTKFVFGDLIYTDGISVSVTMVTHNLYGKKIKRTNKKKKGFKYIDELEPSELEYLKEKVVVGVDPGKRHLVFLTNDDKTLKYSSMQRRHECGFKLKEKKTLEKKTEQITKLETILSKYNSKSCKKKEFALFIKHRERFKNELYRFYSDIFFRKMKWKSYIKNQISEQKLVDNIKNTFGDDIILAYGDWSNDKQMKNYIPTKGVGLKRRLAKEFTIYDVHEYNTSKRCCICGSEMEKFMRRKNPRPYKNDEILVNGLLRCKNEFCGKYFDRDLNGSLNIRKIAIEAINGNERPAYLQRTNQLSAPFDDRASHIAANKTNKVRNRKSNSKSRTSSKVKQNIDYEKIVQKIKKLL